MKVHHVGYAVMDIEKAATAFRNLGYIVQGGGGTTEDTQRNVRILFLQNDNECVELVAPLTEDSPLKSTLHNMRGASPYHICYSAPNIKEECKVLRKQGWVVTNKPAPAPAIDGKEVVFLYHKDAGLIELVQE